jgi:serine/threonine protein kinase
VIIYADILGVANVVWVAGDRLQGGKYTIERELGSGRFGITYLVKNRNSDRQVVKTLNDVLVNSLTQQERERKLLRDLHHLSFTLKVYQLGLIAIFILWQLLYMCF